MAKNRKKGGRRKAKPSKSTRQPPPSNQLQKTYPPFAIPANAKMGIERTGWMPYVQKLTYEPAPTGTRAGGDPNNEQIDKRMKAERAYTLFQQHGLQNLIEQRAKEGKESTVDLHGQVTTPISHTTKSRIANMESPQGTALNMDNALSRQSSFSQDPSRLNYTFEGDPSGGNEAAIYNYNRSIPGSVSRSNSVDSGFHSLTSEQSEINKQLRSNTNYRLQASQIADKSRLGLIDGSLDAYKFHAHPPRIPRSILRSVD